MDFLLTLQRNPLEALHQSFLEFGDVVHFQIGWLHAYFLNHPDLIQHVLQLNNRNYHKDTFQYNLLSAITGRGLLTSDGDYWLRQRRLIQPAFHRTRIQTLETLIIEATEKVLSNWENAAESGRLIDIDAEMMRLTLEIIGKALFSVDLSGAADRLTRAVLTALDYIIQLARNPIRLPTWVPTQKQRAFQEALKELDHAVYGLIRERRGHSVKARPELEIDLLDLLLMARDEQTGLGMTDQELRDEVITLIIAGHETVASALTWTWYLLASNPPIYRKLQQLISHTLRSRPPRSTDLSGLSYVRQVFEESLRLYPPAWIITRKSLDADRIGDFKIPPGALVAISPHTIHRHPVFWDQPERFNPERFGPGCTAQRPRYVYIPFGGGPRLCIGDNLAFFEAQLIIARVTQRFRLELTSSAPVEPEPLVTLRPQKPILMRVKKL